MDFMGDNRFLSVWCEIHATTNRQDALETMIVSFPIRDVSPQRTQFHAIPDPCCAGTTCAEGAEAK
jgi:hypothetical protein